MTVTKEEIIEFLKTLSQDERLEVTVKECLKNGLIIGGVSVLGGLIFGPLGLAIGAGISGCVSAATCKKFTPVVEIIATMDEGKKRALAENIKRIMKSVDAHDIANFTRIMENDKALKQQVTAELVNFVKTEVAAS